MCVPKCKDTLSWLSSETAALCRTCESSLGSVSGPPAVRCDVRRQVADTPGAGRVARPPRSPVQSAMRSPLVCGEGAPACVGCGARTTRRRWCGFPAAPRIQATVPRSRNTARRPPFPGQRRDARARGQPHPRLWVAGPRTRSRGLPRPPPPLTPRPYPAQAGRSTHQAYQRSALLACQAPNRASGLQV